MRSNKGAHSGARSRCLYQYLDWGAAQYDEPSAIKRSFVVENETCKAFDHELVEFKDKIEDVEESIGEDNRPQKSQIVKSIEHLRDTQFTGTDMFSSGMQRHYEVFNFDLQKAILEKKEKDKGIPTPMEGPDLIVIGIEEPETNLHPQAQRLIPMQLEQWVKKQNSQNGNNSKSPAILIVVTTHSPFVLKGTCSPNLESKHQVFGFKDCNLEDLTGRNSSELASSGVSGQQAMIYASKMLGAGVGDFFPSPIVMTECSVGILLETLQENVGDHIFDGCMVNPRDSLVINPNGDSDTDMRVKSINDVLKAFTFLNKSKPEKGLLDIDVLVIADDKKHADKLNDEYSGEVGVRINAVALGGEQLEDVYPSVFVDEFFKKLETYTKEWDRTQKISAYMFKELGIEHNDQGKIKADLARFIGSKIKNKNQLLEFLPEVSKMLISLKTVSA